ncbi:DUF1800 family protein, partial [Caulobacter sp.]|uniref:DUF1800 family protein n=1 Tax=Caulobacter sp. TaxID=78 RepID=UPI001B0C5B76
MRIQLLGSAAAIVAAAAVSGGVGGAISGAATSGPTSPPLAAEATLQPNEAARFAKQASFGPTPELIAAIVAKRSISAWLEEQFTLSTSSYADIAAKVVPSDLCTPLTGTDLTNCNRSNFSGTPLQLRFYKNAIENDDQLRQRVAFALSQIVVTSELEVRTTSGIAAFNQILLDNAFGNYRDILKSTTLNPFMGAFLDMVDSNKSQPNEN